jgi:hypothetical protein
MNMHPVFHANLLRRDPNDPLPGQIIPPVPPIVIDGEEEEEIEEIVDSRINRGRLQYKASWIGYGPVNTWYPAENFNNSEELVIAFHNKYPEKPKQADIPQQNQRRSARLQRN